MSRLRQVTGQVFIYLKNLSCGITTGEVFQKNENENDNSLYRDLAIVYTNENWFVIS